MAARKKPPANTVIDGEVVALDREGRRSFNSLQNSGSSSAPSSKLARSHARSLGVRRRLADRLGGLAMDLLSAGVR